VIMKHLHDPVERRALALLEGLVVVTDLTLNVRRLVIPGEDAGLLVDHVSRRGAVRAVATVSLRDDALTAVDESECVLTLSLGDPFLVMRLRHFLKWARTKAVKTGGSRDDTVSSSLDRRADSWTRKRGYTMTERRENIMRDEVAVFLGELAESASSSLGLTLHDDGFDDVTAFVDDGLGGRGVARLSLEGDGVLKVTCLCDDCLGRHAHHDSRGKHDVWRDLGAPDMTTEFLRRTLRRCVSSVKRQPSFSSA